MPSLFEGAQAEGRDDANRAAADWYGEATRRLKAQHLDMAEDPGAPESYLAAGGINRGDADHQQPRKPCPSGRARHGRLERSRGHTALDLAQILPREPSQGLVRTRRQYGIIRMGDRLRRTGPGGRPRDWARRFCGAGQNGLSVLLIASRRRWHS